MIYDSEGNGRLISEADDGNWYDSDGNYYGSWEDIEDAMVNEMVSQIRMAINITGQHLTMHQKRSQIRMTCIPGIREPIPIYRFRLRNLTVVL